MYTKSKGMGIFDIFRRQPRLRILASGDSSFLIGNGKTYFLLNYDSHRKDWDIQQQSPNIAKEISDIPGESISYIAQSQDILASAEINASSIKIFERRHTDWLLKTELLVGQSGIQLRPA